MLTKTEAVRMATSQIQVAPPNIQVNTDHPVKNLLPNLADSQENRERHAIVYREDGVSRLVLQSRVQSWSVNNRVIRTEDPIIAWSSNSRTSLFGNAHATMHSRFNDTLFVPPHENAKYPFTSGISFVLRDIAITNTPPNFVAWATLFPHEVVEVFNHVVLMEAAKAHNRECLIQKVRAAKLMRRELFKLSDRKEFFTAAVKILGRRPTYNEVTLVQVMWPAIEPLMDTPVVIEPALRFHMDDIMKRKKFGTTLKAIERAAKASSASITIRAKREIDPNGVMLPRQWRWLMRQKAITLRKLTGLSPIPKAWQFALYAEFFPDMRKYQPTLVPLREVLRDITVRAVSTSDLPEIVSVFLRALRRHVDGVKNKDAPYASAVEQFKILKALSENANGIEMDDELREANLGTLYDFARDLKLISMEPEASLQFGRQAFDFPFGSKNVVFRDYEFVPLRDHVMVYDEGQRFRHCVFGGHMRSMIRGGTRAYTVIRMSDDAPIGTLLLDRVRSGGSFRYEVSQFAGQLNQNLLYDYAEHMRAFATHLNAEGKHG